MLALFCCGTHFQGAAQSDWEVQDEFWGHRAAQNRPPQSVSLSLPFWRPSPHVSQDTELFGNRATRGIVTVDPTLSSVTASVALARLPTL